MCQVEVVRPRPRENFVDRSGAVVGPIPPLIPLGEGGEGEDPLDYLNPNSLEVITHAKLEPSLANATAGSRYQFERIGYFCADLDSKPGAPVFNRTAALKDTWAKVEKKQGGKG